MRWSLSKYVSCPTIHQDFWAYWLILMKFKGGGISLCYCISERFCHKIQNIIQINATFLSLLKCIIRQQGKNTWMKAILNIWTTKKKVALFKTLVINVLSLNYKRKLHGTPVFMNYPTHLKTVLVVVCLFFFLFVLFFFSCPYSDKRELSYQMCI